MTRMNGRVVIIIIIDSCGIFCCFINKYLVSHACTLLIKTFCHFTNGIQADI